MAWEIGDSFDFYANNDSYIGLLAGGTCWATAAGAGGGMNSANTRFGVGQSFNVPGTGDGAIISNVFGNDTVIYVNFAYYTGIVLAPGGTIPWFGFNLTDGTSKQVGIYTRNGYDVVVTTGAFNGTVLATWAGPLWAVNQWNHLQFKITINNTTGRVEGRINGHTTDDFDTGASLNTRNGTTNNYANHLYLYCGTGSQYIDDFYLFNDQGIQPNTWQGDVRAVQLMPNSDSSVTWTRSTGATNASCVDETMQTVDTDYVSTLTASAVDQYGTGSLATTPNAIVGIVTKAFVRMDDAGPHSVKTRLTSNAVIGDSSTISLSSTYQWLWSNYMVDPSGSAAWTAARANAATIGPFCVS
jgi:hypothetical protein